ncbi:hypothetical protein D3C72_1174240 [compost metagenome]
MEEWIKDAGLFFAGNADASVADFYDIPTGILFIQKEMNCDGSLFRELQGIAYKIEKHLAQASGVAPLQNGDARINS